MCKINNLFEQSINYKRFLPGDAILLHRHIGRIEDGLIVECLESDEGNRLAFRVLQTGDFINVVPGSTYYAVKMSTLSLASGGALRADEMLPTLFRETQRRSRALEEALLISRLSLEDRCRYWVDTLKAEGLTVRRSGKNNRLADRSGSLLTLLCGSTLESLSRTAKGINL